jgi:hypothetical protein
MIQWQKATCSAALLHSTTLLGEGGEQPCELLKKEASLKLIFLALLAKIKCIYLYLVRGQCVHFYINFIL